MKVHHGLICFFFFLALQDGNTGLVNAQIPVYSGTEGQAIRIQCSFPLGGSFMYFCKEPCEEKVLFDSAVDRVQTGRRYTIQHRPTLEGSDVFVTITYLLKSDSGLYQCGLIGLINQDKSLKIVVDALQDGNTGLFNAQMYVFSGTEGQDIRFQCPFSFVGSRMYFCREKCQENVLIDTTDVRDQRGRFSLQHITTAVGANVLVTIRNLMKSDSGWYWCGSSGSINHEYHQIRIIVVDAVLERNPLEGKTFYKRTGGNIVVKCSFDSVGNRKYFCRNKCIEEKNIIVQTTGDKVQRGKYSVEFTRTFKGGSVYVSITQLKKSDSGRYRCATDGPLSSVFYREFNIAVSDGQVLISQTSPVPSVVTPTTTGQSFSSDEPETEPTLSTDRTTSGPDLILPASTISVPSGSKPTTTTKSLSSDRQETETTPITGLVLYTVVTLVIVVIILGLALIIICIRWKSKPAGLITRENTNNNTNMEMADYENCSPVSSFEDVTYLTLHPATRDLNQTYSTLTHT